MTTATHNESLPASVTAKRTRRRKKRRERRGATLVEFAIVSQIFFLITLTCIEFVRLNMIRNLVQDAAYFGARVAMVPGATSAEATAEANRILNTLGTRGAVVSINGGSALDQDTDVIEVSITVPMDENALIVPALFTGDREFQAEVRMATERYDGFFDASTAGGGSSGD
ncbi:MAG: TadE family protein [Planctomycetota bacterium]